MTSEIIFSKIKLFCCDELEINENITKDDLLTQAGIDSIGFMMLIVYIEEEFGIEIEDSMTEDEKEKTFADLVDYIMENRRVNDGTIMG